MSLLDLIRQYKYKILYGACIVGALILIKISLDQLFAMSPSGPNVTEHVFEFFGSILLVALGIYFRTKSNRS